MQNVMNGLDAKQSTKVLMASSQRDNNAALESHVYGESPVTTPGKKVARIERTNMLVVSLFKRRFSAQRRVSSSQGPSHSRQACDVP